MATAVNSISTLAAAQKNYNKACRLYRELKEMNSLSKAEKQSMKFDCFDCEILGAIKGDYVHISHYKGRVMTLEINDKLIFSINCLEGAIYGFEFGDLFYEFKTPIEHNRELNDYDFFAYLIGQAVTQG